MFGRLPRAISSAPSARALIGTVRPRAGTVKVVDFVLFGQSFAAMSAGPLDPFNHAVSFVVNCDNQAELDRYWEALAEGGGEHGPCGWLKDRFGVSWQVVPKALNEMMDDPDTEAARRAMEAMLRMGKLDVAELRRAFEGKEAPQPASA